MAIVPVDKKGSSSSIALLGRLRSILDDISREEGLKPEEIIELLKYEEEDYLPVNIFLNRELGVLEAAVKYLHEERNRSLAEISRILNRDRRTVWSTYHLAAKKHPERFLEKESKYTIPAKVLANRELGVLESLTVYLKETYSLKFSEIGAILQRDQRTVWTAYHRAKSK
ncbi:MAG: hypothetical protein QXK37_02795 [Candidatus Woesearchaeota archaeon]